ncbi:MAG: PilW family protein [Nitrosomonadales bacterium]
MISASSSARRSTAGFGLVEVMVGLVIAMLGIIIMMQVTTIFGAQKRTSSGGNEALSTGAIVMYNLQRELGLAGYGVANYALMGCDVQLLNPASQTLPAIAPVTINHGSIPAGDAGTDTILIAYTRSDKQTQGSLISAHLNTATYGVQNPATFSVGEVVLAQPPYSTALRPACTAGNKFTMDTVASINTTGLNVTTTNGSPVFTVNSGGATTAILYDFGMSTQIVIQAYAIRNSILTRCDLMLSDCFSAGSTSNSAIWVPIADNIVGMRAQYGVDTNNPEASVSQSYVAVSYQSTPIPSSNPLGLSATGLNSNCMWARVPAVRIALVARNNQLEKTVVTQNPLTWAGSATSPIDLSANANWQNYRYAVFETTIPLRNSGWIGVQPGC